MRRIVVLALALLALGTPPRSAEPPLFDGHIHYSRPDWTTYTPDQVFAILDQAGIRRALVSSTPDDGTLKLYERDPKRVIPILRPYRTRDDMSTWWKDPAIIAYLEQRLAKGVHRGIGEFHIHGKDIRTPELARITSRWEQVVGMAGEARKFLKQLPPDVAEKIAYKNIERLFP